LGKTSQVDNNKTASLPQTALLSTTDKNNCCEQWGVAFDIGF